MSSRRGGPVGTTLDPLTLITLIRRKGKGEPRLPKVHNWRVHKLQCIFAYVCLSYISIYLVSLSLYHLSFYLENHGSCSYVQFQSNTTVFILAFSLSIFVTPFSSVRNFHKFIYLVSSLGSPPPLPLMDTFLSAQAQVCAHEDDLVIVFTLYTHVEPTCLWMLPLSRALTPRTCFPLVRRSSLPRVDANMPQVTLSPVPWMSTSLCPI